GLVAGDDVQAARELGRGQGRDGRAVLWLAVDVLLPVRRGGRGAVRLAVRDHGVGVVEDGERRVEPVRGGLAGEPDEPTVAGREVDRQAGGGIAAGRVVG